MRNIVIIQCIIISMSEINILFTKRYRVTIGEHREIKTGFTKHFIMHNRLIHVPKWSMFVDFIHFVTAHDEQSTLDKSVAVKT